MEIPSMMSFITCEPARRAPAAPNNVQRKGSTSRRNRKSDTSCQLPGGRIAESRAAISLPFSPRRELLSRPRPKSSMGKKARNILKATACDTMPHCGTILASVRNSFLATDFNPIASNYTVGGQTVQRFGPCPRIPFVPALVDDKVESREKSASRERATKAAARGAPRGDQAWHRHRDRHGRSVQRRAS